MRIEYQVVSLDQVMAHWAKDYKLKEGGSVELGGFWVDSGKGKAVIKLYVTEDKAEPCNCTACSGESIL